MSAKRKMNRKNNNSVPMFDLIIEELKTLNPEITSGKVWDITKIYMKDFSFVNASLGIDPFFGVCPETGPTYNNLDVESGDLLVGNVINGRKCFCYKYHYDLNNNFQRISIFGLSKNNKWDFMFEDNIE